MSENNNNDDEQDADLPEMFSFCAEDRLIVERLGDSIRRLIRREDTTPEQIFHLAKLLFALECLPLPTSGIHINLSLGVDHANGEMACQELELSDSKFSLSTRAWIISDPSLGGESQSDTLFSIEMDGCREMADPAPLAVMDWLDAFENRINDAEQMLKISDWEDSSDIDWESESGDSYWDKLESNGL